MKKHIITFITSALMLSLTACSNSNNKQVMTPDVPTLIVNDAGLTEPTITDIPTPTETPTSTPIPRPTEIPVVWPSKFDIGDTLIYPNVYQIKMTSMEFTTKVEPSNPDGYYSYYEVKDPGKVYIHTTFRVKNLKGSSMSADDIFNVKVLYDGKYEYNSFSTIEESGGSDFTYTSTTRIVPLTNGMLHYLISVPKEVQESGLPVLFTININGSDYYYQLQ